MRSFHEQTKARLSSDLAKRVALHDKIAHLEAERADSDGVAGASSHAQRVGEDNALLTEQVAALTSKLQCAFWSSQIVSHARVFRPKTKKQK